MLEKSDYRVDCLWITLFATIPAVVLRPFQNTPFIDDWVYAWTVENLLKTGSLRILDISTSANHAQVLWGALFCLPFGFSFTALRVSTWVASVLGLIGLYLLLREVGVIRRNALLGVACLGAYPVYFILSFSFMTDVPFSAAMTWAAYCLLRAQRARRDAYLLAAAALACLAIAVRLVGLVFPCVMLLVLILHSERWGLNTRRILMCAVPFLFFGLLVWFHAGHIEHRADLTWIENSPPRRMANLKYGPELLPKWLFPTVTFSVSVLASALLPLAVASVTKRHASRALAMGIVLGLISFDFIDARLQEPVLSLRSTWSLYELGASEVPNPVIPKLPPWWSLASAVTSHILFAFAFVSLTFRRPTNAQMTLIWILAGNLLLMALLWFFYDRYVLALAGPAIALCLSANPLERYRVGLAFAALLFVFSMVATHDHLRYNGAVWQGVERLRGMGARDSEIDGGYAVNGWLQYAHPDDGVLRAADNGVLVPGVNNNNQLRYQVSNVALPGRKVLGTIPYRRQVARSGNIYLLEALGDAGKPKGGS